MHEETRNGLNIKILYDEYGPGFEDLEESCFILAFHSDCWIEGPKENGKPKFTRADIIEYREGGRRDIQDKYFVFDLSAYIHSGTVLYLGDIICAPFDTPSPSGRGWDTSLVGVVMVEKQALREHRGKKCGLKKTAQDWAKGLVDHYNHIFSGEVYGYEITDNEGKVIDSCWGFVGPMEYCLGEARASVDTLTNKGQTDHNGQMLFQF